MSIAGWACVVIAVCGMRPPGRPQRTGMPWGLVVAIFLFSMLWVSEARARVRVCRL